MARVLIIADDLTGALECGARFASHGVDSTVQIGHGAASGAEAVVIDTESRHLSGEAAAEMVRRAVGAHDGLIYKKTDSTLRGNIGAELAGLADLYPASRIAYVPAYPAMGRIVQDGILFVNGVPVAETAFGKDPLNPVHDSRVRSTLAGHIDCEIFDGETDREVELAADTILADSKFRIIAGPAAIGAALAARFTKRSQFTVDWPRLGTALIVNGSLHEASYRQVNRLRDRGRLPAGWRIFDRPIESNQSPLDIARETGILATAAAEAFDALFVFGGDTAFGVLEAWGRPLMRPVGEILPGVALSRVDGRSTILLTKPGGYGGDELLCDLAVFG